MHDGSFASHGGRASDSLKGLLGDAPAISLELDAFSEELYSDDRHGTPIEDLTPDYSILDQIEYKYPVNDAYSPTHREAAFGNAASAASRNSKGNNETSRLSPAWCARSTKFTVRRKT